MQATSSLSARDKCPGFVIYEAAFMLETRTRLASYQRVVYLNLLLHFRGRL